MQPLDVPSFIAKPTGNLSLDIFPLISLLSCLPTLRIYWLTKRRADFVIFSVGFVIAGIYHYCYLHKDGLEASEFLGLNGSVWRTLDIVWAYGCLVRTLGHVIGAHHTCTLALTNVVFPVGIIFEIYRNPGLKLMPLGLGTLIALSSLKITVEGLKTFPRFSKGHGLRAFLWAFLGFTCFVLPNRLAMYWFWHSLWHLFLGLCYYELYVDLERENLSKCSKKIRNE
ncbi:hypothetical protein BSKO_06384 [Bryopsis sp. KO-2023]|nr:hypothetical protein BSKO_06384 [Bryopsis sp. KO-2023]